MNAKVSTNLHEVAALAGVSIATVSRVLNHPQLVKDSTQTAVRAAMESLSYERNEVAASLRTQNTRTLAGVVADVTNPFFPAVLSGLQAAADSAGYLLLLVGQPGDAEGLASVLRQLQRRQVSGIVLIGLHEAAMPDPRVFGDTPRVVVDRRLELPDSMWVGVDHLEAAELAVAHLTALGHREISIIAGPADLSSAVERLSIVEAVARTADLTIRAVEHGDFSEASGVAAVSRLLDREHRATAVFAFNDLMAIGAIAELSRRHISVPAEMSVLGFDGIELGRYITPQLTSIQQPIEQLGRIAGELLIDALESDADMNRAVSLEPTLFRGGSTAAPRKEGETRG